MARPISWLSSVRENLRSVTNSVRSHFDAADLGRLLGIQKRSAQQLLELMPREAVGQAFLVKREDLQTFLERVRDAGSDAKVRELLEEMRKAPAPITRRKIRGLVRQEADGLDTASLPENLRLRRGHLDLDWRRPEELAEAMLFIAKILETAEFERDFCFTSREVETGAVDLARIDAAAMKAEIIRLRNLNAIARPDPDTHADTPFSTALKA